MNKTEKKFIKSLHIPKTRRATGLCLVEGARAVSTFLASRHPLYALYMTEKGRAQASPELLTADYTPISTHDMEAISAANSPSGIAAVFAITPPTEPLSSGIVCARLQDPGNVGTLIRTAAACNKKTVILVESVDPWSPKVIQASAGTIAQMNVYELSWPELKAQTDRLYALVTQKGVAPRAAHKDGLFVVGNEANGIPQEWVNECSEKITLAMPGNTESLNAAVAGSIALYMTLLPD